MAASDQFREQLDDRGYDGLTALAYDAWLPPGTTFPDDVLYERIVERCGGTALELGSGNGRFLIPARERGLDVEGLDSSAGMLDRCRVHARSAHVAVTLHHADMAPLALGRKYRALICPAGSFTLIADADQARAALASYRAHLEPGGQLAFGCHTAGPGDTTGFLWRLRRTGTAADTGITYVAHEAVGDDDTDPRVHLLFSRVEAYGPDGSLLDTTFRRVPMRWWTREAMRGALTDAGFDDVQFFGDDHDWAVTARAV